MKNIYLIGPRASGKSTLGSSLAQALSRQFVDMDQLVQWMADESVAELVAAEGWQVFRQFEALALAGLHRTGKAVVATGGGAVLRLENRNRLRQGACLLLWAPADVLVRRLELDPDEAQRPSLTGEQPAKELARVMAEREPLYLDCAHAVLDASLPHDELVRQALDALRGMSA